MTEQIARTESGGRENSAWGLIGLPYGCIPYSDCKQGQGQESEAKPNVSFFFREENNTLKRIKIVRAVGTIESELRKN